MAKSEEPPYPWNIRALMRTLEKIYLEDLILKQYWPTEKAIVEARFKALQARLQKQYAEPEVIGVGGAGIVLKMADRQLGDRLCALKFPRPVANQTALLKSLLDKEIRNLATFRHTSIIRIHARGVLLAATSPPETFPYYVMDFILGQGSSQYFRTTPVDEAVVIRLVTLTLRAVAYMHSKKTAHLDLKPDNILVDSEGNPTLADLGTAKHIGPGFATQVACTDGYVHPELARCLSGDPSDPNRVKGTLEPSKINLKWDLYSLGKTILNWLGYDLKGERLARKHHLSPYATKYLLLMSARLLDGEVDQWLEDGTGLSRRLLKDLSYAVATDAEVDARKLSGEFSLVHAVPELNAYHPNTLQIAADGPTTYSDRLKHLIHHPFVKRLASITQLGLVNQVYPTAVHSRLEHSVGTYHNACRFILSLYYDPLSPLFRQIVTAQDIKTLLVAAVLHDIGQYPLAHDLEEIDQSMFDHRQITSDMLNGNGTHEDATKALAGVMKEWSVRLADVQRLLTVRLEQTSGSLKTRILHSIIDGPLDADKLDYLQRDSDRLKVPYADGIDAERILRSLTVIVKPEANSVLACIGVHEKARVAAEFVAITRYALFSQAYWQHTVRSMKAMLTRAVWKLIVECEAAEQEWQRTWWNDFRAFVTSLPGVAYGVGPAAGVKESWEATRAGGSATAEAGLADSSLTVMDAAVVRQLQLALERCHAPEAELLADLSNRSLYKRLLVFSEGRHDGWQIIQESWDKLGPRQRLKVMSLIEADLATQIHDASASSLSAISVDSQRNASLRVQGKRPLILLDVPGDRPGASVPLHYVVESQRRALRKDARAVGQVQPSDVWHRFGTELRKRAGKVRVFCAPDVTDILETTLEAAGGDSKSGRAWFVESFEKAVRTQ